MADTILEKSAESATLDVEINNKEFDERIQVELEAVNKAISDINHMSNHFQRAKEHFLDVLDASKSRLKKVHKRYPYGIEKARPYFDLRERCIEAKQVMYSIAARYRDACMDLEDAKAAEVLAEQTLLAVMETGGNGGGIQDPEILAKLNKANDRVLKANAEMDMLENDKDNYMRYVNDLDLKLMNLGKELRHHLEAAWPYFKLRAELKTQLDRRYMELRNMHFTLQDKKQKHSVQFEHLNDLSSEIAQRQIASSHQKHTLTHLSKFEELDELENFELDESEDPCDSLAASTGSMVAMCSFDSSNTDTENDKKQEDVEYGAKAYTGFEPEISQNIESQSAAKSLNTVQPITVTELDDFSSSDEANTDTLRSQSSCEENVLESVQDPGHTRLTSDSIEISARSEHPSLNNQLSEKDSDSEDKENIVSSEENSEVLTLESKTLAKTDSEQSENPNNEVPAVNCDSEDNEIQPENITFSSLLLAGATCFENSKKREETTKSTDAVAKSLVNDNVVQPVLHMSRSDVNTQPETLQNTETVTKTATTDMTPTTTIRDNKTSVAAMKTTNTVLDNKAIATVHNEKTSATVSDKKGTTTVADKKASTTVTVPNTKETTATPDKKVMTTVPDKKATTTVPDKKATTAVPNKKATTTVPDKKVTTTVPEKKITTVVQDKKATTTVRDKKATTTVPDKKATTTVPDKKVTTTVPEKKITTAVPDKKATTTVPDKKVTTTVLDKKATTTVIDKKLTTTVPDKNATNTVPDKKATTNVPDKKVTTTVPDKKATTTVLDKKVTTTVPDKKVMATVPDKKATTTVPDKKATTIVPEKKTITTTSVTNITTTKQHPKTTTTTSDLKTTTEPDITTATTLPDTKTTTPQPGTRSTLTKPDTKTTSSIQDTKTTTTKHDLTISTTKPDTNKATTKPDPKTTNTKPDTNKSTTESDTKTTKTKTDTNKASNPDTNKATTKPDNKTTTTKPDTKTTATKPDVKTTTTKPDTKTTATKPDMKTTTTKPDTKTTARKPDTSKATTKPDTNKETTKSDTKTIATKPDTKTTATNLNMKTKTSIPLTKMTTAEPDLKTTTSIPDKKAITTIPYTKTTTSISEPKTTTTISETKTTTTKPDSKTATTNPYTKTTATKPDTKAQTTKTNTKEKLNTEPTATSNLEMDVKKKNNTAVLTKEKSQNNSHDTKTTNKTTDSKAKVKVVKEKVSSIQSKRQAPAPPALHDADHTKQCNSEVENDNLQEGDSGKKAAIPVKTIEHHENTANNKSGTQDGATVSDKTTSSTKKQKDSYIEIVQTKTEVIAVNTKPKYSTANVSKHNKSITGKTPERMGSTGSDLVGTVKDENLQFMGSKPYVKTLNIKVSDTSENINLESKQTVENNTQSGYNLNHSDSDDEIYDEIDDSHVIQNSVISSEKPLQPNRYNSIPSRESIPYESSARNSGDNTEPPKRPFRKAPSPPDYKTPLSTHNVSGDNLTVSERNTYQSEGLGLTLNSAVISLGQMAAPPKSGHFRQAPPPPPSRETNWHVSKSMVPINPIMPSKTTSEDKSGQSNEPIYENISGILPKAANTKSENLSTTTLVSPENVGIAQCRYSDASQIETEPVYLQPMRESITTASFGFEVVGDPNSDVSDNRKSVDNTIDQNQELSCLDENVQHIYENVCHTEKAEAELMFAEEFEQDLNVTSDLPKDLSDTPKESINHVVENNSTVVIEPSISDAKVNERDVAQTRDFQNSFENSFAGKLTDTVLEDALKDVAQYPYSENSSGQTEITTAKHPRTENELQSKNEKVSPVAELSTTSNRPSPAGGGSLVQSEVDSRLDNYSAIKSEENKEQDTAWEHFELNFRDEKLNKSGEKQDAANTETFTKPVKNLVDFFEHKTIATNDDTSRSKSEEANITTLPSNCGLPPDAKISFQLKL